MSYRFLELSSPVLIALEQVKTSAARAEQHHVALAGEGGGRLGRLGGGGRVADVFLSDYVLE